MINMTNHMYVAAKTIDEAKEKVKSQAHLESTLHRRKVTPILSSHKIVKKLTKGFKFYRFNVIWGE
jgi:hypothetical protein